jgi:hypothetical protein
VAVVLTVVACAWCFRGDLLQGAGGLRVAGRQQPDFDWVLIPEGDLRGDGRYDEAARLYREDSSRRIVLIELYPEPVVQAGALPPYDEIGRRELAARGVPAESVELIPGQAATTWAAVRLLRGWLRDEQEARVLVLVDRFRSRQLRHVVDSVLGAGDAARVSVGGLADRRYDETNWWQSRRGVAAAMFAGLELACAWCEGESHSAPCHWVPDDYERMLRRTVEEVPR